MSRAPIELRVRIRCRLAGDRYVQVDYGPMELDIKLRVRVHCLMKVLADRAAAGQLPGLVETSPGVRSCMVEYDIAQISPGRLLQVRKVPAAYCTH